MYPAASPWETHPQHLCPTAMRDMIQKVRPRSSPPSIPKQYPEGIKTLRHDFGSCGGTEASEAVQLLYVMTAPAPESILNIP